jgi:hypothetical protein
MAMEMRKGLLFTLGLMLAILVFTGRVEAIPKCLVCHGKPTLSKTLPSGRVI